ncbi:MAG: sodium:proton antiporter [Sneathiella sp.]|jgi:multicomponent Na+:H+ antiporter subunit G|uniref:monovalent cation/H(+) antiporter subunit G n=1 Tax=Sneathiella sp. TaxID=1964365 RepID=UPI000C50707B|nr:monovalent cation/H(+) antiporter subunit G [Sneathiella sp.]MAL79490.1 sodium:proton antiporter [Sneathiella sp.]|tara:strand:+ start:441 stop:767 length:327 start_codon:yes stop_codon:yes gene_type:complete
MIDLALDIATWILLLAGGLMLLITGLGLLRLPDLYTRIHAGGMADTLATAFIFFGMALQSGFTLVTAKLLMIVIFIFFTSPTASYALAQASFVAGLKPKLDGFEDEDA